MKNRSSFSAMRTVGYISVLVIVIATIIALVCLILGLVGFMLENNGVFTLAQMTSPNVIASVILLGSFVIAVILSFSINHTLVRPLRRMTSAMTRLAHGDFEHRIAKTERLGFLQEVREFAESYNVAAAELASTEMMRSNFISDFSHEFRTPINSLSGFAQLLMDDDLSAEERREYAGIIVEESQRLAGLSERILLLSKMETAAILPNIEIVDISEQLRRCVVMLEPKLKEAGVEIDLALDTACVPGNAAYLGQLWLNILDNAIKFSPTGGRISIALYGGRAEEEGHDNTSDSAVVWISDEGIGMDSTTQAHIFDRFYQGDSSHASKGSGLGLALCKRIAELHGGTIDVQSAPRKGSVFEVRLPLHPIYAMEIEHQSWLDAYGDSLKRSEETSQGSTMGS